MKAYNLQGIAGLAERTKHPDTGCTMSLYVAEQAGIDSDEAWMAVCETHGCMVGARTRAQARESAGSPEWCEECAEALETTMQPNATTYGRRFDIRRGYLLVPQEMTAKDGKVYTVDLEYQVFDAETGEPISDTRRIEGEQHGQRLIVGDPHRDTRLFEYKIDLRPTSESENYWRGYQAALGDRQWHREGSGKKYYAQTQAWWDGYNQGHRDKKDPSAGYTPNHSAVYYVWLLDYRGVPLDTEGPYGPMALDSASANARIAAKNGDHDRVVSLGLDPEAKSFEIVRRYRRGTGERIL